jgi:hypothetical protein
MPQWSVARVGCSISAGTELYSLCQTAAPDGRLTARELERLADWLEASAACDVPALPFVRGLIAQAIRTGTVTPADLQALAHVLEPSFPQVLRQRASRLRLVERDSLSDPQDGASVRARNDILASACFMVAGCGGRRGSPLVPRQARAGEPVLLVAERAQGAARVVEVRSARGRPLGFVPAERAQELAPLLARGGRYRAHLIMVSSGVHAPVLVVQAFVYRGDAALGFPQASARRFAPRRLSRLSWMLVRASIALALAAAAALALRT